MERRRYIRIPTVLTVQFFLISQEGKKISSWIQGFTENVAKGGIALWVNEINWQYWDKISSRQAEVFLNISLSFPRRNIFARAKPVWTKKTKNGIFDRYGIGLEFSKISAKDRLALVRFARLKNLSGRLLVLALAVFSVALLSVYFQNKMVMKKNERLLKHLISSSYQEKMLEEQIAREKALLDIISRRQRILQKRLKDVTAQRKQASFINGAQKEGKGLQNKISRLHQEITLLKQRIAGFQKEKAQRAVKIKALAKQAQQVKGRLHLGQQEIINRFFDWIKTRQDRKTGLVLSFEGDHNLKKVAFSYDQALAAIVFSLQGDFSRARKILDFYARKGPPYYNGYYANDGSVFEYIVHSGPNAWIGLAFLNYTKLSKDKRYLPAARRIGVFLKKMMDKEGGLKGGPKVSWYSTEHNLDAYAFFKLLFSQTKNTQYLTLADKILHWLDIYAYTDLPVPIQRGKGDSTIATDTYAWSITAVGPGKLGKLGMNAEKIMDFAVESCRVNVTFGGRPVTGFDFARFRNSARGGVVSCEWTAQMVLALEILEDYFSSRNKSKASRYREEASFYLQELEKTIINSPSKIGKATLCLPYATKGNIATGHGWRTPQGKDTGSLAATAYFIFASQKYNPLTAQYLKVKEKEYAGRN